MFKKICKVLLILFAVVFIAVVVLVIVSKPRPILLPPLPHQNGYDDFLAAARLIQGDIYQATTNRDPSALRGLLATNAEPLRLAHLGLTRETSAPTGELITNFDKLFPSLSELKHVGQLLAAEGKSAGQDNRPADAAGIYLDTIRYGDDISRGGLVINRLVGIACETIGFDGLLKVIPKLTCEETRPLIAGLEKIDRTGVTWNDVMQGENAYMSHALRASGNPVQWVMGPYLARTARKKAELKNQIISARLRLLTTELALRCFQTEQGKAPDNLEQLVPKYLQAVPHDPFSERPLNYQPAGTNWQISSIGLSGKDGTHGPIKLKTPNPGTSD